jgi:sporulation protein YlmC with PRC-barrel domain
MIRRGEGPMLIPAGDLIGTKVKNFEDEELGRVKDVVIDMEFGTASYAILTHGGFLGMGEKLYAVPFQALEVSLEGDSLLLDVSMERLLEAPGISPENWTEVPSYEYLTDVYNYFGSDLYWLEPREK